MLREFLAMGAAFGFLIFFPKGKLWNGASLLLTGLIMGLGAVSPQKLSRKTLPASSPRRRP